MSGVGSQHVLQPPRSAADIASLQARAQLYGWRICAACRGFGGLWVVTTAPPLLRPLLAALALLAGIYLFRPRVDYIACQACLDVGYIVPESQP